MKRNILLALLLVVWTTSEGFGQAVPTTEPSEPAEVEAPATRPVEAPGPVELGERFESKMAGIALSPPADLTKLAASAGAVENVVVFGNEKKRMGLTVTRLVLPDAQSLRSREVRDEKLGKAVNRPGLLDTYETNLAGPPTLAKVLRKDVGMARRRAGFCVSRRWCDIT